MWYLFAAMKSIKLLIQVGTFMVLALAVAPATANAADVEASAKGQGSEILSLPIPSGAKELILQRSYGFGKITWLAVEGYQLGDNSSEWAHYIATAPTMRMSSASDSASVETMVDEATVKVENSSSFTETRVRLVQPGSASTGSPFYKAMLDGHIGTAAGGPPSGYAEGSVRLGVPLSGNSEGLYLPIEIGLGFENVGTESVKTLNTLADHGTAITAAMGLANHSRFGLRWALLLGGSAGGSGTTLGSRPAFVKGELRQPLSVLNRTVEWGLEGIVHVPTNGSGTAVLGSRGFVDLRLGEVNGSPITFGPWVQTRSEGVETRTMGGLRLGVNLATPAGTAHARLPVGLNNQGKSPGFLPEISLERD